MVAPGYFASAAAFTLAAVVPDSGDSPACPLADGSVPVGAPGLELAALAVPLIAIAAPPPNPARSKAPAASDFLVLFNMQVLLESVSHVSCSPASENDQSLLVQAVCAVSGGCHHAVKVSAVSGQISLDEEFRQPVRASLRRCAHSDRRSRPGLGHSRHSNTHLMSGFHGQPGAYG
jgi:hypothetical protein